MNYIAEINNFYDWLETNELPKSAVALWHALMHVNNRAGWTGEFAVAISTLEFKTKFRRSELFEARNVLAQKGRIGWRQRGGNSSAVYWIVPFCVRIMDANTNTKESTASGTRTQIPTQKGTQFRTQTGTINKLNKTKQNMHPSGVSPEGFGEVGNEQVENTNPQVPAPPLPPAPRFQKPTLEEVAAYCRQRGNNVDPAKWFNHYESNGWKVGRNPMRDWKAAVRTWEKNSFGSNKAASADTKTIPDTQHHTTGKINYREA